MEHLEKNNSKRKSELEHPLGTKKRHLPPIDEHSDSELSVHEDEEFAEQYKELLEKNSRNPPAPPQATPGRSINSYSTVSTNSISAPLPASAGAQDEHIDNGPLPSGVTLTEDQYFQSSNLHPMFR